LPNFGEPCELLPQFPVVNWQDFQTRCVFCYCSASASRFDILCVQGCSLADLDCNMVVLPDINLTETWNQSLMSYCWLSTVSAQKYLCVIQWVNLHCYRRPWLTQTQARGLYELRIYSMRAVRCGRTEFPSDVLDVLRHMRQMLKWAAQMRPYMICILCFYMPFRIYESDRIVVCRSQSSLCCLSGIWILRAHHYFWQQQQKTNGSINIFKSIVDILKSVVHSEIWAIWNLKLAINPKRW